MRSAILEKGEQYYTNMVNVFNSIDNVGIQHPLAEVEIVAWDSSLTLLISKDDNLVQRFRDYFPLSEDLSALNTMNNRKS